ncbi:transcriptional regulator [Salinisphaera dokdonensis CL-ES53]|uniref:Transcriptional regulator n=1 Tax=Salinisphaera dokdonensis CL-ES53 TaxID=1304272 RepID=A0ABV2AYJ6_9GAMM
MTSARFTLRQLEIFSAVVRTGQVKRAAQALHLSQAAVSQALTELADALGLTLFERRGRDIVPTASARQLLTHAAGPMAALKQLPDRLGQHDGSSQTLTGAIVLAASSTIARYVLPTGLATLRRDHPELDITVLSGNSARIEAGVADLQADVGFIEGPAQRADLAVHAWRTDNLQIIAPPDYPVHTITADDLGAHAWVARESGSGTRAVFEQSLALAGLATPRAALVIDDSGAIVRAVANGAGLACVSQLAARQASAANPVQFVDLPALSLARPLWRVRRDTLVNTPIVDRFCTALDQALA